MFLKWHFCTISLLPEHSYTLFRVRKQTFFIRVDISRVRKFFLWPGKGIVAPFQSCCRAPLPQPWSGSPGHWSGKMGSSASGWLERATSLIRSDVCPVLVAGLSYGGLLTHYTVRCMRGISVSANRRKSPFRMSLSHKAATGLDGHIAELVAPSAVASPVFAMLWPLELTLKQIK